jgi:hypothetical protein
MVRHCLTKPRQPMGQRIPSHGEAQMPEITDAQAGEYRRYTQFGTPDEVDGLKKEVERVKAENAKLRDKKRELEATVPPEGAKVLTGDDAKRWEAFQALQKSPEELAAGAVLSADDKKEWEAFKALEVKAADVPNIVKERDELKTKDEQRSRLDAIAAVVKAMNWPDETAATIGDLRSLDGAVFEVKKEKTKDATGADVDADVPYVTVKDGQAVKFSEFAAQTDALKGIRTSATEEKSEDRKWPSQVAGAGKAGAYDAAKEGREMAEKQKASGGNANLALT